MNFIHKDIKKLCDALKYLNIAVNFSLSL